MIKTRQQRKDRLNVESMASFNGVDQYATAGVNQNIVQAVDYNKDFAISFFCDVKKLNDVTRIIHCFRTITSTLQLGFLVGIGHPTETGRLNFFARRDSQYETINAFITKTGLYHFVVQGNAGFQNVKWFANSVQLNTVRGSGSSTITDTLYYQQLPFNIGLTVDDTVNPAVFSQGFNGSLSHLIIFNRVLTQAEISYIHQQGGLLPASTHAACVAHYPMTHRQGATLLDVVGMYNYAKPQYIKKPKFENGLSDWTISDANGTIIYDNSQSEAYVEVEVLSSSDPRPRILYNGGIPVPGEGLSVLIDIEILTQPTTAGVAITIGGVATKIVNGTGRKIATVLFPTSLNTSSTTFYIQPSSNDSVGLKYRIYSIYVFKTSAGLPLVPYHATLTNYTTSQHTGSAQTAWKDFYTKQNLRPFALPLNGVDNYIHFGDYSALNTALTQTNLDAVGVTLEFYFWVGDNSQTVFLLNKRDTNLRGIALAFSEANTLNWILAVNNSSRLILVTSSLPRKKWIHAIISGKGRSASNWKVYTDQNATFSINQDNLPTTYDVLNSNNIDIGHFWQSSTTIDRFGNIYLDFFRIYNRQITDAEAASLLQERAVISALNSAVSLNTSFQTTGTTVENEAGTAGTLVGASQKNVEKASLLPPLKNALKVEALTLNQHIQITRIAESAGGELHFFIYLDSVPTGERYLFNGQHNSATTQFFITSDKRLRFENNYGPGVVRVQSDVLNIQPGFNHFGIKCQNVSNIGNAVFYWNGQEYPSNIVSNAYNGIYNSFFPKLHTRQSLFVKWSSSNDTYGAWLNCRLIAFFAFNSARTTRKQVLEAFHNTLFKNLEAQANVVYQANQIIDTAGVYTIASLGSSGGSATLVNYTADDVFLARRDIVDLHGADQLRNGLCIRLDRADNEYIQIAYSSSNTYFLFPILWFFPIAAEEQILINFYARGTYIRINADGTLFFAGHNYTTTAKVKFGEWNHFAMRNNYSNWDGMTMMLNGQYESNANGANPISDEYLRIGTAVGAVPGFNGYVFRPGIMQTTNNTVDWSQVAKDYNGEIVYGMNRIAPEQDLPTNTALGINTSYHSDDLTKARAAYIYRKSGFKLIAREN